MAGGIGLHDLWASKPIAYIFYLLGGALFIAKFPHLGRKQNTIPKEEEG